MKLAEQMRNKSIQRKAEIEREILEQDYKRILNFIEVSANQGKFEFEYFIGSEDFSEELIKKIVENGFEVMKKCKSKRKKSYLIKW